MVHILPPRIWRPLLPELRDEDSSVLAIVDYMHGAHVGISAKVARSLASLIDSPRRTAGDPWRQVLERLSKELLFERAPRSGSPYEPAAGSPRIVPTAIPFYFVSEIALPLVNDANALLECTYLFGDDEIPLADEERILEDYLAHEARQIEQLKWASGSQAFWMERAYSAVGLCGARIADGVDDAGTPDPDVKTAALLCLLRPDAEEGAAPSSSARSVVEAARERAGIRPQEGGVEGFRLTTSEDDIPNMSESELLHEPLVLMNRILNDGFLAKHRPPLRQRARDVLVVGLSAEGLHTDSGCLAKASWFEAMMRLSALLRAERLPRSDFVWIEPDPLGGLRRARMDLEAFPPLDPHALEETPGPYRSAFLSALRWLPGFVDQRAGYDPKLAHAFSDGIFARHPPLADEGEVFQSLSRGLGSALEATLAGTEVTSGAGRRAPPLPVDADLYGFVHVALIAPASRVRESQRKTLLNRIRRSLSGMGDESGRSVSGLWLPEGLGQEDGWHGTRERGHVTLVAARPVRPAGEPVASAASLGRISGAVVEHWLRSLEEAIFGG